MSPKAWKVVISTFRDKIPLYESINKSIRTTALTKANTKNGWWG